MPVDRCKYSKECPVFKGEATTNGIPLTIYKNVFCNRGLRGWNNCKQYLEFKVNTPSKKTNLMLKTNKNIDKIEVTQEERQVLLLLEEKGKYLYENIFKELKIAHTKCAEIVSSLTNKGYIKNAGRSSLYELAINL